MEQKMKNNIGTQHILQLFCAHPNITITESGEPQFKKVGEKYQNKNETIIHNTIINAR